MVNLEQNITDKLKSGGIQVDSSGSGLAEDSTKSQSQDYPILTIFLPLFFGGKNLIHPIKGAIYFHLDLNGLSPLLTNYLFSEKEDLKIKDILIKRNTGKPLTNEDKLLLKLNSQYWAKSPLKENFQAHKDKGLSFFNPYIDLTDRTLGVDSKILVSYLPAGYQTQIIKVNSPYQENDKTYDLKLSQELIFHTQYDDNSELIKAVNSTMQHLVSLKIPFRLAEKPSNEEKDLLNIDLILDYAGHNSIIKELNKNLINEYFSEIPLFNKF